MSCLSCVSAAKRLSGVCSESIIALLPIEWPEKGRFQLLGISAVASNGCLLATAHLLFAICQTDRLYEPAARKASQGFNHGADFASKFRLNLSGKLLKPIRASQTA